MWLGQVIGSGDWVTCVTVCICVLLIWSCSSSDDRTSNGTSFSALKYVLRLGLPKVPYGLKTFRLSPGGPCSWTKKLTWNHQYASMANNFFDIYLDFGWVLYVRLSAYLYLEPWFPISTINLKWVKWVGVFFECLTKKKLCLTNNSILICKYWTRQLLRKHYLIFCWKFRGKYYSGMTYVT